MSDFDLPSAEPKNEKSYLDVLYEEWIAKLAQENVFDGGEELKDQWVGLDNYVKVIEVFKHKQQLNYIINHAFEFLSAQPKNCATVQVFCTHMVEYVKKMQTDLTVKGFQTTAQLMTDMLK